jgi:phage-related protein
VKPAVFHPKARDVIRDFPENIRREFGKVIFDLQKGEKLSMPFPRPMYEIALAQKRLKEILDEES